MYERLLSGADPGEVDLGVIGLERGIHKVEEEPGWVIFSSVVGVVAMGDPDYPCKVVDIKEPAVRFPIKSTIPVYKARYNIDSEIEIQKVLFR